MRGNSVSVIGGITRDAEVRRTGSGNNAVKWGIAWTQRRKNQQGDYEDVPNYFDVECWMSDNQLNARMGDLVKGAKCAIVDAHLEYQGWQDNQGNKRSKTVIRVDDPISGLLVSPPKGGGFRRDNGGSQGVHGGSQASQPIEVEASVYDDDIPF